MHTHLIPLLQGIIACTVQCFYAWRVKVVTSNLWVAVLITITATISMRELFLLLILVQ